MQTIRVLVVDDDPTMVRLAQAILRSNGFTAVQAVGTARQALEALGDADVVLLDHQLPDASGLEMLDAIRARPHPPSVIMVTAHCNESLAASALRRGADDYLAKDASLAELLPQVLERVRRTRELRKALVAAERDLVRVERLGAIGELTVTLHHEINNPLMSALADVQLLLAEPGGLLASHQDTLRSVETSLHRISHIIRRIGDLREARTKTYIGGVEMIDLGGRTDPVAAVQRGTALVCLAEEELARVVALLLRHVGFAVERQEDPVGLIGAANRVGVTLVVLAGGTGAAGTDPLGGFIPPADRAYRVVALVRGEGSAAIAAGADRVVQLPFDPGTFTTDIIDTANRR
ncbi:MAG TPA: response regulator [Gemmatimonadales bacterium]|nr:response regulator [Gemmatimonadales bacterium]